VERIVGGCYICADLTNSVSGGAVLGTADVGQTDTEIVNVADVVVAILVPEAGDVLQRKHQTVSGNPPFS